jgi:sugar lactone lactonase YvrE
VVGLALGVLASVEAVTPTSLARAEVTPTSTITTLAGNGPARFAGDGGPATAASLNQPRGRPAVGPDGSIYVADTFNNRIRRIAPNGVISTVAGTGVKGFSGDGGPAVNARLSGPHDVAVDGAGNVYIADAANHRIRRVTADGVIRTVAGTGSAGFNGDGIAATAARLNRPKALVLAGSRFWFSDGDNNRIRRVDLSSGIISTVAGTGVAGFSGDGGPALRARIRAPRAIDRDTQGNLYFADSRNNRIRRVGPDGIIRTVAGTGVAGFSGDGGPATRARLNVPRGLTVGGGMLYIADSDNSRVRRVDLGTGIITTLVGNGARRYAGDGGPAAQASLYNPRGVAIDPRGRLLISDTLNNRIRAVGP